MLRRRRNGSFELLEIEGLISATRFSNDVSENLATVKGRVFSQLGAQMPGRQPRIGLVGHERWVLVPAGIGLAAAVIAAVRVSTPSPTQERIDGPALFAMVAAGSITVDGTPVDAAESGQTFVAEEPSWIGIGGSVRLGLEAGSSVEFDASRGEVSVRYDSGNLTVATEQPVRVYGSEWSALVTAGGAAKFETIDGVVFVSALEGSVVVTLADGQVFTVRDGSTVALTPPKTSAPNSAGVAEIVPPVTAPVADKGIGGATDGVAPTSDTPPVFDTPPVPLPVTSENAPPPVVPPVEPQAAPPETTPPTGEVVEASPANVPVEPVGPAVSVPKVVPPGLAEDHGPALGPPEGAPASPKADPPVKGQTQSLVSASALSDVQVLPSVAAPANDNKGKPGAGEQSPATNREVGLMVAAEAPSSAGNGGPANAKPGSVTQGHSEDSGPELPPRGKGK